MHIPIIILSVLFSLFSVFEKEADKDNPPIKKVSLASYSVKNSGKLNRKQAFKKHPESVMLYNQKGALYEQWQYETDGSIWRKTEITFNHLDKIANTEIFDADNNLISNSNYDYDEEDHLIKIETFSSGELTQRQLETYDSLGNNIKMLIESIKYGYTNEYYFTYDSLNRRIQRKKHNGAQNKTDYRKYKFDEKGNEVEELFIRHNGSKLLFKNSYDEKNNLTKNVWFEKGEQTHITTFTYVYDKYGNWITKKRSSNGELSYVWERKIQYY